jgi:hypothetical protein
MAMHTEMQEDQAADGGISKYLNKNEILIKFRPGYPPDGGRRPPPPGWNPPPSYDDATSGGPKPSGNGSSGPGFYSGMGLGALGGYLFGRNWQGGGYGGYGNEYRYRGPSSSNYYNTGYGGGGYDGSGPSTSSSGPSTSSSSSSTHTSSGTQIFKRNNKFCFRIWRNKQKIKQ